MEEKIEFILVSVKLKLLRKKDFLNKRFKPITSIHHPPLIILPTSLN